MPTVAGWTHPARRAAGGGHDLGRRQERAGRRHLPVAGAPGGVGRAVQGAEHEQQLGRDRRRRRDRAGPGDAGARVRARAERRVQPGAAQAGQRPVVAGRRARAGAGHGQRAVVPRAQGRAARRRHRDPGRPAVAVRRRRLRGRRLARRDQPAGHRHREHGAGPGRGPAGGRGRRHRPGGVLAHLFGTVAVLSPADQARIAGFVVNKFRGDPALLAPGLEQLRALTGRPTLGVVRGRTGCGSTRRTRSPRSPTACSGGRRRRTGRSGCGWRWSGSRGSPTPPTPRRWPASRGSRSATSPSRRGSRASDLVVLPGSKATVADLGLAAPHRAGRRGGGAREGRSAGARDLRSRLHRGRGARRHARRAHRVRARRGGAPAPGRRPVARPGGPAPGGTPVPARRRGVDRRWRLRWQWRYGLAATSDQGRSGGTSSPASACRTVRPARPAATGAALQDLQPDEVAQRHQRDQPERQPLQGVGEVRERRGVGRRSGRPAAGRARRAAPSASCR